MSKVAARGPTSVQYHTLWIQCMVQQAGIGIIGMREPRLPEPRLPGDAPQAGYVCYHQSP